MRHPAGVRVPVAVRLRSGRKPRSTIMKGKTIITAALAALAVSCSVWEDRSLCPCLLSVDLRDADMTHPGIHHSEVSVALRSPGILGQERVAVSDFSEFPFYEREVPRRTVTVSAWAGADAMDQDGAFLLVPYGQQCDSLYAHSSEVDCRGEEALATAVLHKQFATLRIDMVSYGASRYPYSLRVSSGTDGIDASTLIPHEGEFVFMPEAFGPRGDRFSLRVPRLLDGQILLEIMRDGRTLDTLDIGEAILRGGYSWLQEDLDDILLTLDMATLRATLTVLPWDREVLDDERDWII